MATALAAQLAQLAAAKPAQERYVKGKPSLLFDYQKAADVSVEQILNIARTGESLAVRIRSTVCMLSMLSRMQPRVRRHWLPAQQ